MAELLTFALGLISAYFATQWKARRDLEADYDKDLRASRIKAYCELWKLLEPLAKYSPPGPITPELSGRLAVGLRHWYFNVGGLFLSGPSRDAYFALQDALKTAADPHPTTDHGRAWDATAGLLRKRGSGLRSATAADVGTRRTSAVLDA
jgi:hypothetical protein